MSIQSDRATPHQEGRKISLKTITLLSFTLNACISTAFAQTSLFRDDFSGPKLSGWQPSMSIAIAQSNQQFVATGTSLAPLSTNDPAATMGDGFHAIPISGPLPDNQTLEARVDLVRVNQDGVQADLHVWGDPEAAGYGVFKDANRIGLLKFWNWASSGAWFFYDSAPPLKNENVTLILALTRRGSNLEINTRVLDKDNSNAVLYDRTVTDTPAADPALPSGSVSGERSMADVPGIPPPVLSAPRAVCLGVGWLNTQSGPKPAAQVIYDNVEVWQYESPPSNGAAQAGPLEQWTWRYPLPTGNNLLGVSYGSNLFVAAGAAGTIVTSPDGSGWMSRTSGTESWLRGVAYGNKGFVAVGDGGTILTSPDGITWTKCNSGTTNDLAGIGFGDNQFVAVGGTGGILTSSNGVTWTNAISSTENDLQRVVWGNNRFVAVGNAGAIVTSLDGVTWSVSNSGTTNSLSDIAYGNNQFVAVARAWDGADVLTSPDGLIWTNRPSGARSPLGGNPLSAIAYGNDLFVAHVAGYGPVLTSRDGVTWTTHTWQGREVSKITYGNGLFVAVGNGGLFLGSAIETSPDGITWTNRISGTADGLSAVAYGNNQYVAVGWNILTSPDGVVWADRGSQGQNLFGLAYGQGRFMAVGAGPTFAAILTSADGIAWTSHAAGTIQSLSGLAYGNDQFVAVGPAEGFPAGNGVIMTSPDGSTWTRRDPGTGTACLAGIAYGNNQFVAVGYRSPGFEGLIVTSPDANNWTVRDSGTTNRLYGIVCGNNLFVAVGEAGTILNSRDGATWTNHSSTNANPLSRLYGIAYADNQFVAVGVEANARGGVILTSPDGITWTARASKTACSLNSVANGNSTFVIVGGGAYPHADWLAAGPGMILQSGVLAPPRPALGPVVLLAGGVVQVALAGLAGQTYPVQASTNLIAWLNITNVALTNASGHFVDPAASKFSRRFYRAVVP